MAGQRVSRETLLRREKKSGNGEIPSANLGGGNYYTIFMLCPLNMLLNFVPPIFIMPYIEKKKIGGREYFYLMKNVRVSKNKWKKISKYIGTDLSNLAQAQKELELAQPTRRIL